MLAAYRKALCEERPSMQKDLISNSIHFLSGSDFPRSMSLYRKGEWRSRWVLSTLDLEEHSHHDP